MPKKRRPHKKPVRPLVVLPRSDWGAIADHLTNGDEPWHSAWLAHKKHADSLLNLTPTVFAGPYRGVEDWNHVFDTLNSDGAAARDLAIAYVVSGDAAYAHRAIVLLDSWAVGNTPTTQQDCDKNDIGYHQSYGAFSFAYAYELVYELCIPAEHDSVTNWFHTFVDAIGTSNDKIAADYYIKHPEVMTPYDWNPNLRYRMRDTYVGSDAALCGQCARLAMAATTGYGPAVADILGNPDNVLGFANALQAALTPLNDGDGIAGHPVPAPHVYIGGGYTAGRGGTLDYMTYNTRSCHILYDMARNLGRMSENQKVDLYDTWSYLGRFFGPGAESDPNASDHVNVAANLPRFALAYRSFGDPRFLDILNSGNRASYTEPQFLGPVTLTHSVW